MSHRYLSGVLATVVAWMAVGCDDSSPQHTPAPPSGAEPSSGVVESSTTEAAVTNEAPLATSAAGDERVVGSEADESDTVAAPNAAVATAATRATSAEESDDEWTGPVRDGDDPRLSAIRMGTGVLSFGGSFNSFCSYVYVHSKLKLSCESNAICGVRVGAPYAEFYKPTLREVMDLLAFQTESHWFFQDDDYGFMYQHPAWALPFEIEVADGWSAIRQNGRVEISLDGASADPPALLVYYLGRYSPEDDEPLDDFHRHVRSVVSLEWIHAADNSVNAEQLASADVAGVEAAYFAFDWPERDWHVRQWVFLDAEGSCIGAFCSAPTAQSEAIVDAVDAMVASLTTTPMNALSLEERD